MPSDRNLPPQEAEDDIVEKKPSHPVTTVLLIVSTLSLLLAIFLSVKELGYYVNPPASQLTNGYKKTAVQLEKEWEREFATEHQIKSWGVEEAEASAPAGETH